MQKFSSGKIVRGVSSSRMMNMNMRGKRTGRRRKAALSGDQISRLETRRGGAPLSGGPAARLMEMLPGRGPPPSVLGAKLFI